MSKVELVAVSDLFEIRNGHNLALNQQALDPTGVNFISRTTKNNGVTARISGAWRKEKMIEPEQPGCITTALSATPMLSFLQLEPFYTGYHVAILRPRLHYSIEEMLFFCECIQANAYRYSYGRQANKTLPSTLIPAHIPAWVADQTYLAGKILRGVEDFASRLG